MKRTLRGYLAIGFILTSGFAGLGQSAALASPERSATITIHVYNYAEVAPNVLMEAEKVATGIFRKAGVEIRWLNILLDIENDHEDPADKNLGNLAHIQLILISRPMAERAGLSGPTMGFAPGGGRNRKQVYLLYYRAEELARQQTEAQLKGNIFSHIEISGILGHAMAHELGHVLGLDSHSPAGLMHAVWNLTDLQNASFGKLLFTRHQTETIRIEVQRRNRQDGTPVVAQRDSAPMPR